MTLITPNIGTVRQIEGFDNVHALNGFPSKLSKLESMRLYQYIDFDRFQENTEENNHKLVFVSPATWDDKFERRFLFTNYKSGGRNFTQKMIRCMCFTNERYWSEEAGWKAYSCKKKNGVVRLSFKLAKLLESLDKQAVKNGFQIYIGEAIYGLEVDQIKKIHDLKNVFHETFFPEKFGDENYLSLMLLKRKAFAYEHEIRMFLYFNEPDEDMGKMIYGNLSRDEKEKRLYKIPVNYKDFLEEIRISPLLENGEFDKEENYLRRKFEGCVDIKSSKLYDKDERELFLDQA